MDWIHCNNCFVLPDREKAFFLTSCGHIYCRDCEEQCARGKCKLCGNQCSTITLSSALKPDVQIYFTDPDELLKKKIKEVQQVSEFQKNHRARLMAHHRKQHKKFNAVKEDFRKLLKRLKDLDSERKNLVHENEILKKFIGMQRNHHGSKSTGSGHHGHSKTAAATPQSHPGSVFSMFSDRSGGGQRMCVISPPIDGKLGVIPGTYSPSTALSRLNVNTPTDGFHKKFAPQYDNILSSPDSFQTAKDDSMFVTPQTPTTVCSQDSYKSPAEADHKRRDIRKKLVVHPFSPND